MKPSDVLEHATSEIALPREIREWRGYACELRLDYLMGRGSKLGIDATKKIPGEPRMRLLAKAFGFRGWPPLIKMDAAVKAKVENLFGGIV